MSALPIARMPPDGTGTADKPSDREVAARLEAAVERFLARDRRNYLAVSGGLDSMVLMHAASTFCDRFALSVVHVDHGLQPQSSRWAVHVQKAAEALGLEYQQTRLALAGANGIEARARAARYAWFAERLNPGDHLLTAHHQSDQAETALLRMLQGRGGYGMPEERALGQGRLCRPLLRLPRELLLRYATSAGLAWLEDQSNADVRFTRNFVRHELMPRAKRAFANAEQRLATAATVHSAQEEAGRQLVSAYAALPRAQLRGPSPDAAVEVLRWWLLTKGLVLKRDAVRDLAEWLTGEPGQHRRVDTHNVWVQSDAVHLARHGPSEPIPLRGRGWLQLAHGRLEVARPEGVTVRFRRGGERLLARGRGVKLAEIFRVGNVHPAQRDGYPLLYIGDELVAVPNLADPLALGAVWRENYGGSVEVDQAIC